MEQRKALSVEQLVRLYDLRQMGDNFAKIEHIFRQESVFTGASALYAMYKNLLKYINGTHTGKQVRRRFVEAAKIINDRKQKAPEPAPAPFYHPDRKPATAAPVVEDQPKTAIGVPLTNGTANGKYKEAVYDEYELLRGSLNTFLHDIESFIVLKVQKVKAENDLLREENKEMKKALDDAKFYNFVGTLKKKLG